MTSPSLDNLPPELLDNIVNLIEDEAGWDDYPTNELLNMRETCRTLERACHNRFLLYFHEWVIDTAKDKDLSITKAVLASNVHAAAIEKITFTYKREGLSLWKLAPLLQEIFNILASLDRKLILILDPFADFDDEKEITDGEVMYHFNMILVMVAVSKLVISSIQVRARREDWDKRHIPLQEPRSLQEPHRTFKGICHCTILTDIHDLLIIEEDQGTEIFPPLLVAKYPSIGEVSFNYLKRHLKVRNLQTFHWTEFRDWIEAVKCKRLEIKGCSLAPRELERILSDAQSNDHPIRRLSIIDTVLYEETARDDEFSPRTSVHSLIRAIMPYAHHLEYVRFLNILGGVELFPDSFPAFGKGRRELELRGTDEMRMHLARLNADYLDQDAFSRYVDGSSQDEDAFEIDTI
jgi:hypothetical protein